MKTKTPTTHNLTQKIFNLGHGLFDFSELHQPEYTVKVRIEYCTSEKKALKKAKYILQGYWTKCNIEVVYPSIGEIVDRFLNGRY